MESVGRMTRSRAKALGTTPVPSMPTKTPEPKTTGRRRKTAAETIDHPAQVAEQKQLHFEEAAASQPDEQQQMATENQSDLTMERSLDQVTIDAGAELSHNLRSEEEGHVETHDNASVLMASPILLAPKDHSTTANVAPVPLNLDDSPPGSLPASQMAAPQPESFSLFAVAQHSPMLTPSPIPVDASPLPIAASPAGFDFHDVLSPEVAGMEVNHLPVAGSPLSIAGSPLSMGGSPLSVAASQMPAAASPLGFGFNQDVLAPSPPPGVVAIEGSPLPVTTPLSFTSDAPRNADTSMQPMVASFPSTPLSVMAEAVEDAVFSPMPDDDQELQGSPVSLSGGAALTPQLTPVLQPPHDGQQEEFADDAPMADATPLANPSIVAASPLAFASDLRATPVPDPSPVAGFISVPDSVPHAAATSGAAVSSFQGFAAVLPTPIGVETQPESPSLEGLVFAAASAPSPSAFNLASVPLTCNAQVGLGTPLSDAMVTPTPSVDGGCIAQPANDQHASGTTMASPLEVAKLPPAPAPTPESGAPPGWTLPQTPLAAAIASSISAGVDEDAHCEDGMDGEMASCEEDKEAEAAGAVEDSMEVELHQHATEVVAAEEQTVTAAANVTPSTITKTPSGLRTTSSSMPARSPLTGSAMRTPTAMKHTGSKATPAAKASTPSMPSASRPSNPYVFVESRYNKTPVAAAAAAPKPRTSSASAANATPVAPTNAAAGAKSIKRVSIHTPEGPRAVAPQRQIVVPTPFRPKSAQGAVGEQPVEPVASNDAQLVNPDAAACSDDRRVKAAERLKAIHATEQGLAAGTSSGPGYLAPTQAFAVKASKAVKSKVDAGSYDPRSLRQLKREIKDATAKKKSKAIMVEARNSKLTPKVAERQLPMPDDHEDSDDQAEYDEGQENDLVAAMTGLEVAPPKNDAPVPLRGLPAPQGRHIRFNDKGKATASPQRTVLRGLPVAVGKYKRFE